MTAVSVLDTSTQPDKSQEPSPAEPENDIPGRTVNEPSAKSPEQSHAQSRLASPPSQKPQVSVYKHESSDSVAFGL